MGCSPVFKQKWKHCFPVLEDPSSRSFSEIISSVSDVKFSHSGRYWMSQDHLSVGVWDLNTERQPVETHQARPWVPPPRPSCASIKVHEYLEASCVRSMRMTASLTALSAAGVATTGEARVGTQPSRGRVARARLPDVETGCLGTFLTLLAIPSMSEQQAQS